MDRESEYFEKELSRSRLDKAMYGLIKTVRDESGMDLSVNAILSQSYKYTEFRYEGVKPKRLANYLSLRRLLLDSESKYARNNVRRADNQMLGAKP